MTGAEKDIVERLDDPRDRDAVSDAQEEITNLRAEVERLRSAHNSLLTAITFHSGDEHGLMGLRKLVDRAGKAEAALAKVREAALEAVICAEANCLTKDAPATHRLRASLTEGE